MLAFATLLTLLVEFLFTNYLYSISRIMGLEVEIIKKKQVFNNRVTCFNFSP